MGVNIRLYDINSTNDFKVEYATSGYSNPYTFYNTYSGGTNIVVITGVNYNTIYFIKITDTLTGQYSIQPITITDPNCYSCYSGSSSYCYEIDTTGGGNYTFTYDDVLGNPQTGSSNNEITNICAKESSIITSGTGALSVTTSFNPCSSNSDCLPSFTVSANSIDKFVFSTLRSRIPFRIEWGDGAFTEYPANWNGSTPINGGFNFNTGHTYSSPYTGLITVKANDLSKIEVIRTDDRIGMLTSGSVIFNTSELSKLTNLDQFYGINTELYGHTTQLPSKLTRLTSYLGQLSGETSTLPTGLTLFNFPSDERNIISGDTIDLPRTLTTMVCYGVNTITGYINNLPTGLTRFELYGSNSLSGDTTDLNPPINKFVLQGQSRMTGDIANIPLSVTSFIVVGYNLLYGDLQSLTSHTIGSLGILNLTSSTTGNTVTGDIKYLNKNSGYILIAGKNTIYGNLSDMPTGNSISGLYFNVQGFNTIEGDISSINVAPNITTFWLGGNNTVSGNTNSIPNTLEVFVISGDNTLTGNISDLPNNLFFIEIYGNNTANVYSGKTWRNGMNTLALYPTTKFSSTAVDRILQDVSGYTWTYSPRFDRNPFIYLHGTGTTASYPAIAKITGATPTGYGGVVILDP